MTRTESTKALKMATRHNVDCTRHRFGYRGDWAVEFPMDRTIYDLPSAKRHIAQLGSGSLARATADQKTRDRRVEGRGWKLVSEAKFALGQRTWDDYGVHGVKVGQ
jgi:hypothetical protein